MASSSPRLFIGAMLDKLGLLPFIDAWESAEEVAAGMTCIGFRNPCSGDRDLSAADYVVSNIKDIQC